MRGWGEGKKSFWNLALDLLLYIIQNASNIFYLFYTNATLLSNHVSASQELQPAL